MEPYEAFSQLAGLPPLVKKQRTLEARIVKVAPDIEQEKAVRQEIDRLLVNAGIEKGDGVTCNGYDVVHVERAGTSRLNQDVLVEQLVSAGMAKRLVLEIIDACTETGDPSHWATVKPSKGAKVRR